MLGRDGNGTSELEALIFPSLYSKMAYNWKENIGFNFRLGYNIYEDQYPFEDRLDDGGIVYGPGVKFKINNKYGLEVSYISHFASGLDVTTDALGYSLNNYMEIYYDRFNVGIVIFL